MQCTEVKGLLTDLHEGLLDEGRRKEVEGHLHGCPRCTAELEEYRKTVELLRALPEVEEPQGFAARLAERLGMAMGADRAEGEVAPGEAEAPVSQEEAGRPVVTESTRSSWERFLDLFTSPKLYPAAGLAAATAVVLLMVLKTSERATTPPLPKPTAALPPATAPAPTAALSLETATEPATPPITTLEAAPEPAKPPAPPAAPEMGADLKPEDTAGVVAGPRATDLDERLPRKRAKRRLREEDTLPTARYKPATEPPKADKKPTTTLAGEAERADKAKEKMESVAGLKAKVMHKGTSPPVAAPPGAARGSGLGGGGAADAPAPTASRSRAPLGFLDALKEKKAKRAEVEAAEERAVEEPAETDESRAAAQSVLSIVSFAPGETELGAESKRQLRAIATLMKLRSGARVEIRGHSLSSEPGGGKKLAKDRTRAVRDYLLSQGVGRERIRTLPSRVDSDGKAGVEVRVR